MLLVLLQLGRARCTPREAHRLNSLRRSVQCSIWHTLRQGAPQLHLPAC